MTEQAKVYRVTYRGFLQDVVREFPTIEEATTWARQAGAYGRCKITEQRKGDICPHPLTSGEI